MAKIPDSIGPYKVSSSLGRGGTSQVYRAVHPSLKKTVVLKKLTLGRGVTLQKRFQREADLMMTLNHPNIVRVFDFFKEGRSWVIVQEYVEGLNLDQLIHLKGRLNPHLASWIILQCARALHFIHRQGIIHRDVKPSNIFISRDGQVKLGDFGIAARIDDSQGLTREGAALGTPDYMPPEQILDPASVDHRADIYSLGISYYEAMTGQRYSGDQKTRLPLMFRFCGRTILKAVRKKPFFRYRSLTAMKIRLRLSGWGGRRSNRRKLKQAMDEGRRKEPAEERQKALPLLGGLILPLLMLILPLGGIPLWREVIRPEHYGKIQLVLPLTEEKVPWLKEDLKVRLYLQKGDQLSRPRKLRLIPQSGESWSLASRVRTLPSGYYRMELKYQGRIEWNSFFLRNRKEQRHSEGPLVLTHRLIPVSPLPLQLETRVQDCFSGADITGIAHTELWMEGDQWVSLNDLEEPLQTGRSYSIRVRAAKYQEFHQTQYFDLLQTEGRWDISLIPQGGTLILQGEPGKVGLKIDGESNYLSLDGAPRLKRIRFDGSPIILRPGSYRLDFSYQGQLFTLSVDLEAGEELIVGWEEQGTELILYTNE